MPKASVRPVKKTKSLVIGTSKALKPMERHEMIASEAYSLAEQRGFQGGDSMADWLKAEKKVDSMYAEGK